MKNRFVQAALGFALVIAVGCNQSTTTTGPKGNVAGAKRLTLTAAKEQTIKRGDTDKVKVSISRDNFSEPVTIKITGLPKGVTVVGPADPVIVAADSSTTLTLQAAADADVGEHAVTLSAEAAGVDKNTQAFRLTVK